LYVDANELIIWGFKPIWLNQLANIFKSKRVTTVFGDPNAVMGFIDTERQLSIMTASSTLFDCVSQVQQAVYCQGQDALFVLDMNGSVYQYNGTDIKERPAPLPLPKVRALAASQTHVLFLTSSLDAPVYAVGSNRFSQLGIDYSQQMVDIPTMIDYFGGLSDVSHVACGLFHSAVIMAGDVYTFGWDQEGRLGCGVNEEEDIVRLAVFLDAYDQPVEVSAIQVVCGSAHTVVLDDQGSLWTCGSSKFP
jgi:alpha-tubulin suppressor-like RCC1 family protein